MAALHAADEATIIRELDAMGVECIEPASEREQATAALMEAFAAFVLEEQAQQSLAILEENCDGSVGELQGGGEHAIYRVEITDDDESVVSQLLRAHGHGLTVERIRRHMLMCQDVSRLDNFMLVLAFGPTKGQIRHIDAMVPNRQLCCYMSRDCPSTVVYAPDGPAVDSGAALVALWEESGLDVPAELRTRLVAEGARKLAGQFKFWRTIDDALRCFGKLYQPVARRLALTCAPGTLLSAGGNDVHAGPPTSSPRMFAFAVGVPEDAGDAPFTDGDGEVQYNAVLFHLDLCCVLFGRCDDESKLFLLNQLVPLVSEHPDAESYSRQLGDARNDLAGWLARLVEALPTVDHVLREAAASESLFCTETKKSRRQKRREKRRS